MLTDLERDASDKDYSRGRFYRNCGPSRIRRSRPRSAAEGEPSTKRISAQSQLGYAVASTRTSIGGGHLVSDDANSRFSSSPIWGFLGQPDEKSFGAADIAESIRVLVLNHFTDELRAVCAEPGEHLVDVVHSEHDA